MDYFDIVIQNGHVIDPASGIDEVASIGVSGQKITEVAFSPLTGKNIIDAAGCIVTQGFIDFHTHLFDGGSVYGLRPDYMISQGVTAAVDAGTSGSAGFEAFYRSVIASSALTIKAFVSLGATGLCDPEHPQNYAKEKVNIARLKALKEKYPHEILGLKVAMSRHDVGELGIGPWSWPTRSAICGSASTVRTRCVTVRSCLRRFVRGIFCATASTERATASWTSRSVYRRPSWRQEAEAFFLTWHMA